MVLIGGRDDDTTRCGIQSKRADAFFAVVHSFATSFVSNTQYHITSANAILKAKKSKRNNDVRAKLYPQSCGDFFGFAAADEPLLSQVAKHGDDAEILRILILWLFVYT